MFRLTWAGSRQYNSRLTLGCQRKVTGSMSAPVGCWSLEAVPQGSMNGLHKNTYRLVQTGQINVNLSLSLCPLCLRGRCRCTAFVQGGK